MVLTFVRNPGWTRCGWVSRGGLFLGVLLAGWALVSGCSRPGPPSPPGGYLIASEGDFSVRVGGRTLRVSTAATIPADTPVQLPEGARATLLHAEGRIEAVAGPTQLLLPAPPRGEDRPLTPPWRSLVEEQTVPPETSAPLITSPVSVTRFTTPEVRWIAQPGQTYDVALGDPADPLWPVRVARGVTPPLAFSQLRSTAMVQTPLAPDRIYELIVREADRTDAFVGTRFLTTPEATAEERPQGTPSELLIEAALALARPPFHLGDAWQALVQLPAEWRRTELALRLRLHLAASLGLAEEFAAVLAEAKQQGLEK